jgi:hypothetical protein
MPQYINTETGEDDLTEAQVRAAFPNISFCEADFPPAPYAERAPADRPSFNPITQDVVRAPSALVDGVWTQQWSVVDVAEEVAAQRLSDAQAMAWERIKGERDRRRLEGGAKVGELWFKSDDRAVGEYVALATIGAALPGTTVLRAAWRTMAEGVTVDMTPNLVKQILSAGFAQVAAIDDAAQAHRAAMEQAADPLAYDFSAGWPSTFEDQA